MKTVFLTISLISISAFGDGAALRKGRTTPAQSTQQRVALPQPAGNQPPSYGNACNLTPAYVVEQVIKNFRFPRQEYHFSVLPWGDSFFKPNPNIIIGKDGDVYLTVLVFRPMDGANLTPPTPGIFYVRVFKETCGAEISGGFVTPVTVPTGAAR